MNPAQFHKKLVWEEKHQLPEPLAGGASALFDQSLLLAGGTNWKNDKKRWLDRVDLYDFEADQWRSGPRLPRVFAYGCSAMTHDGFEIIGGCDAAGPYRSCWQLKSEGSTWRVLDDAPEDFIFAAAESWERNLYIFGGCSNDHDLSTAKDTVWMRDANHHWHPIGIMPQGRMFICAHTSIAEKIYFFGGCTASENGGVVNHDDVFSFDCKTYGWTRLHSLPVSSRGASAVVLYGGRIAILGGYGETFLTSVLIYDVKRNLFTEETPLPVGVLDAQFVTHRGTLYGAGGEDGMRKRSARLFAGVFTRFI